jgi:hypothetical protein
MPQLEPELSHLTTHERMPLRQPAQRKLDLYYRDAKGHLRLWSRLWPVLPREDFDPECSIYLILEQGAAVVMRATMENGQVMCTQINPNGARSFAVSMEEFTHLCLAVVHTIAWSPDASGVPRSDRETRRAADGQP